MAVAEPTGNTENVCLSGVAEVLAPVVGVPVAGQLQEPGGGRGDMFVFKAGLVLRLGPPPTHPFGILN